VPGVNYQIIESKLGKRKREGKESNVYLMGQLVPDEKLQKEFSRHVKLPTLKRSHTAQGTSYRKRMFQVVKSSQLCSTRHNDVAQNPFWLPDRHPTALPCVPENVPGVAHPPVLLVGGLSSTGVIFSLRCGLRTTAHG
jgi:hypothetical protein